jgi:glycosyltransferase domain-containing protein
MNLSIFVPTKNRYYYIAKLLDYYLSINFKGELIILDSSDENIKVQIIEKISLIGEKLKIQYYHSVGFPCALMKKFFNKVKTDYVVFSGDDDYFTPSGIKSCIDFLNNNNSYIGCTGKGISVHSSINNKKIDFILNYKQAKIYGKSSIDRISHQFENYKVPIFSIYRSQEFVKFLVPVPSAEDFKKICPDKAIADEYMIEAAMVAYGKIEKLKLPYLVRHIHIDRNIGNMVPDFKKDWIKSKNYLQSKNYFLNEISKIISNEDKIDFIEAYNLLKKKYNEHVNKVIKNEKKFLLKLYISKILFNLEFIRKIKNFLRRNFFEKKIFSETFSNQELRAIMNSIEKKHE